MFKVHFWPFLWLLWSIQHIACTAEQRHELHRERFRRSHSLLSPLLYRLLHWDRPTKDSTQLTSGIYTGRQAWEPNCIVKKETVAAGLYIQHSKVDLAFKMPVASIAGQKGDHESHRYGQQDTFWLPLNYYWNAMFTLARCKASTDREILTFTSVFSWRDKHGNWIASCLKC